MADEPINILLVEDNVDDAAFTRAALERAGLGDGLRIARDGIEALLLLFGNADPLEARPRCRPRLIILDLKVPKLGGLDLLRMLKRNPHTRTFPIVVLSSSQERRDVVECYELGANSYLVKPMDFDEFSETVRTLANYWLRLNQSHPPP